ncbi:MAG TPA: lysophospholipid acyltransferase family protein [Chthoniobacterales bacterium]
MRRLWKKIRHRLEVLGMRIFVAAVPKLSRSALLKLANFAGDLVFGLDHRGRAVALENIAIAFGDCYLPGERRDIARKSFRNLARTFLDLFWAKNLTAENFRQLIDVPGFEAFQARGAANKGCLFYSGHIGGFEWMPPTLCLLGLPPLAIVQDIKNPEITPFFIAARSAFGSELIPQERAVLRMLKALKRGKTCGFLVDLTLKLDQPGHVIEAFGLKKYVTGVHVTLSSLAGARLIPLMFLPLDDGRYEFRFLPDTALDPVLTEQQLTQLCWNEIEATIRERPECWLWNYKHWRYQPEGATGYPSYSQTSKKFEKLLPESAI